MEKNKGKGGGARESNKARPFYGFYRTLALIISEISSKQLSVNAHMKREAKRERERDRERGRGPSWL